MLFTKMSDREKPDIPEILKMGRRGANVKIWTFLMLNQGNWYTAKEVAEYLELPHTTAQLSLKQLVTVAPRIQTEEIMVDQRGRRE